IITVNPKIKHEINEQMGRGVTWWNGNGAYTGRQQEILVTCINKYEVRQLSKLVKTLDPDAFVILNDGSPIRGNYEKRLV
ncbi:YitT family protein, partial [Faecalibaculum rodentium]